MNNDELKSNLLSPSHWLRFLFMVLFAVLLYFAAIVMAVVVLLQFIFALVTGNDNANLRQFGQSLSHYILHTLQFLTYNSEEKPFPFSQWPDVKAGGGSRAKSSAKRAPARKSSGKPAGKSGEDTQG